ncbi:hypothetical protein [Streptomyces sp. NPDC001744]|uniref:hypothetical protein n=1 Tax=Streptomyces sp. NPDC001744 TaxID=3364606 RepID=UPI00368B3A45
MVLELSDEEILARFRAGQSTTAIGREAGVDCRTVLRRIPETERRGHLRAQQLNRPAPDVGADTIRARAQEARSWFRCQRAWRTGCSSGNGRLGQTAVCAIGQAVPAAVPSGSGRARCPLTAHQYGTGLSPVVSGVS